MFEFLRKKQSPNLNFSQIRLFGKLPGFADFVRYRSAEPAAIKLDAWLNAGITELMQNGNPLNSDLVWRLILCRQEGKDYHLAFINHSQDRSGRAFPLVLMATVTNAWINDYKPSLPLLFEPLQALIEDLQRVELNSQDELIESLQAFELKIFPLNKREILDQRLEQFKSLTQAQAWGQLRASLSGGDWSRWVNTQHQALKEASELTIPLGSNQPIAESCFWLQALDDQRKLADYNLEYHCMIHPYFQTMQMSLGEMKLPAFHSNFKPALIPQLVASTFPEHVFEDECSLMNVLSAWKEE